jgi:hypothetical protein
LSDMMISSDVKTSEKRAGSKPGQSRAAMVPCYRSG